MAKPANLACARHILVKDKSKAESILGELKNGADFGKLAKKYSTCPSGKKGGDLGEFRRGQMVKAFDDVVFKQEVLAVHGPVKTKFGFHIIQTIYRQ
jgi:peptidyl-prolyl cis-trans isomerase C